MLESEGTPAPRSIGRIILNSAIPGTIDASRGAPREEPVDCRISWAKAGDPYLTWTDPSGNTFPAGTSHTITGLEEGKTYKVMVRAKYDGTAGPWTGELTVTIAGSG